MTGPASCWPRPRGPISTIWCRRRQAKVGVYTANDSAYAAAIDLKKAGVSDIPAIVDVRDLIRTPRWWARQGARHCVLTGHAVLGRGRQAARRLDEGRPKNGGSTRDHPVDALIMSAGWTPSVHMYSQSRGKVVWDEESLNASCPALCAGLRSVGACNGTDGLPTRLPSHQRPGLRLRGIAPESKKVRRKDLKAEAGTSTGPAA
jgi:sarcosine oxidase subunit alpha